MRPIEKVTWTQFYRACNQLILDHPSAVAYYGVPRGGSYVAMACSMMMGGSIVDTPENADIIVDDVEDSGATKERYAKYGKPFAAAFTVNAANPLWYAMPWEQDGGGNECVEDNVRRLLQYVGEDVKRAGLLETPARFVKALAEMTSGLHEDPKLHLQKTFALEDKDGGVNYKKGQIILSRGIDFVSVCEHHLLPFSGVAHIGYLPGDQEESRVVGLSKLARMFDGYARRPQVQEKLTEQACNAIVDVLKPAGAGVVVIAKHSCQCFRGVKKQGEMVTSAIAGCFDNAATRAEFFTLISLKA